MTMSEAPSLSLIAPPPPPPPLPAPLVPSVKDTADEREQSKGQTVERPADCLSACEQGRKAFKNLHLQGSLAKEGDGTALLLSCYNSVRPVLQNGPVCGLVALSMASQLTNKSCASADAIFCEAQKQGFSKQGEMFSVSYMEKLSNQFLEHPVEKLALRHHTQPQNNDMLEIASHLLQRNILLVPYDADKNHSPCQKKGHKAHWAVITGIVLAFPSSNDFPSHIKAACQTDAELSSLLHWPENPSLELCQDLATFVLASPSHTEETNSLPLSSIYVYGHQGKSKHAGLWNLIDLLQSNAQLEEAGPERDSDGYVIPPEGVAYGLKSQMLVVRRQIE